MCTGCKKQKRSSRKLEIKLYQSPNACSLYWSWVPLQTLWKTGSLRKKLSVSIKTSTCQMRKVLPLEPIEVLSGEGGTNYCIIQIWLFLTLPKLRLPSYYGTIVCTILDSSKWQVAWQTCNSACFVGSPQLCCQSVRDGCKLMLISFCWSAYSNSLPGFPFWYARLPVGYVIELKRKKKKTSFFT